MLPAKIILVRHAESEGNADNFAYTYVPDPQVPLVGYLCHTQLPSQRMCRHLACLEVLGSWNLTGANGGVLQHAPCLLTVKRTPPTCVHRLL